jgi:hypothetical protein
MVVLSSALLVVYQMSTAEHEKFLICEGLHYFNMLSIYFSAVPSLIRS